MNSQSPWEEQRPAILNDDLDNLYYEPDDDNAPSASVPIKKVPTGDVYEAARAGDVDRLRILLESGVNVNARDAWDSVALYYTCLAGHLDAARMLLESGAICVEHTFDGDRCHYAALNLKVRRLLKTFEARPPPLQPLQSALREVFLGCRANNVFHYQYTGQNSGNGSLREQLRNNFAPDITFYIQGWPIEAHRAILVARSSFFKKKFQTDWKYRKEVRFSKKKLSYPALYSLIHFFYCDRLDIAVDDMEDLVRICKVCKCEELKNSLEKELIHQKYAEYKSLRDADNSQKRFILQGSSLPEQERLPAAMHQLLQLSLENSRREIRSSENVGQTTGFTNYSDMVVRVNSSETVKNKVENSGVSAENWDTKLTVRQDMGNKWDICSIMSTQFEDTCEIVDDDQAENQNGQIERKCMLDADDLSLEDHADVCFRVEGKKFRCHQVVLASRSEYFKARLSRTTDFLDGMDGLQNGALMLLEEHDLSAEAFEKLLEYMYTDKLIDIDPDQAEEMFDAASRYLLFPLKRAVADALLPHLELASPAELCDWLLLADMYGVWKIREHCLDAMASNFETFAETFEFRRMLLSLPPPSGDSSQRTTVPSAPGDQGKTNQGNVLDDLREKWLEAEAAELDKRDESALQFDKRLEILVLVAQHENQLAASQEQGKLRNISFFTKQHPYVLLDYVGMEFRTTSHKGGGNDPTYDQKYYFPLIEDANQLEVRVYNRNTVAADTLIGSGRVYLQRVLRLGYDETAWPIVDKHKKFAGEVKLNMVIFQREMDTQAHYVPSAPPLVNDEDNNMPLENAGLSILSNALGRVSIDNVLENIGLFIVTKALEYIGLKPRNH